MKNIIELFTPGRLCLMGEHSDWAGVSRIFNSSIVPGMALVTGTEQGIYATATKNKKFIVRTSIPELKQDSFECEMELPKLKAVAEAQGFFSYVAGVASYICEWYHTEGVEIDITKMDLPIKSGLSSSAAVCVLVVKAFNKLYNLHLNTLGIMNIAYWGELRTLSRCGRLDQACAFGTTPVLMTFNGNDIDVERVSLGGTFRFVFADLNAGKNTIKILADLNKAFPFATTQKEKDVQFALGEENQRIITKAKKFLEDGNCEEFGKLMVYAQSVFDSKVAPMCPEELTSPVLHKTLADENIKALTYGGKGVGSQGDGTVQFLAKDEETQKKLISYLEEKLGMKAYSLTLKKQNAVRKAIIPVAGFGTRLYPETRGVKKEFCPVVDKDGLVKPGILVLLEELDRIGIEDICLILNHEEKAYYENFFFKPLSPAHYAKLPEKMKEYEKTIERIAKKLHFAFQEEQRGFGHAVFQANDFANDEPVLLLLGDTIYQSNNGVPCTKQLIEAYNNTGLPMVALQTVPLETVNSYGMFAGSWENKAQTVLNISAISEKPTQLYAKDYLCVKSNKSDENYYGAFGCYILTKDVFQRLDYAIKNNIVNKKDEVELTDALAYVQETKGLMGFVPEGRSYDLGNASAYRIAVSEFGK